MTKQQHVKLLFNIMKGNVKGKVYLTQEGLQYIKTGKLPKHTVAK